MAQSPNPRSSVTVCGKLKSSQRPTAECKLIGYYRDGVPVYGFCRDKAGRVMTSCYKIDPAAALVTVTSVTGVYVGASNSQDYSYQPVSFYI